MRLLFRLQFFVFFTNLFSVPNFVCKAIGISGFYYLYSGLKRKRANFITLLLDSPSMNTYS